MSPTIQINIPKSKFSKYQVMQGLIAFNDRFYTILYPGDEINFQVELKPKDQENVDNLQPKDLEEEIQNSLIYTKLRNKIESSTRQTKQEILNKALAGLSSHKSEVPSFLMDDEEDDEDLEDIATPWEEKYGKKKEAED